MKKSISIITVLLLSSQFYFSPQTIGASPNDIQIETDPTTESEVVNEPKVVEPSDEPSDNTDSDDVQEEVSADVADETTEIDQPVEEPTPSVGDKEEVTSEVEKDQVQEKVLEEQEQTNTSTEEPAVEPAVTKQAKEEVVELKIQSTNILKINMRDARVIDLKKDLVKLGFADFSNPTNYFGSQTKEAVEAFQSYYGLTVTGEADSKTLEAIKKAVNSPFQSGKRHNDSIQIKENLTILGYANFKNPTTLYGSQTAKAVRDFQSDHGLPVSGIADSKTIKLLEQEANNAPLEKGMRRVDAIPFKENLVKLGFASFKNPNNYFGSQTETATKKLQSYYGISQTGKADDATLSKMNEILSSPFQSGKRHQDSIQIKENLTILGYASFKNPTTLYGSQTAKAVKEFQKDNGLPVSGIADPNTIKKLEELANAPLEKGVSRADAIPFKENLVKLGFASFKNPNNYFGTQTEAATKKFQSYYGLSQTGKADNATLSKMDEILSSPFQSGKRHQDSVQLKENLNILGYASFKNPTTLYGSQTAKAVREFQKDNGLPVSGIADPTTIQKLNELASGPLERGMYRDDAIELKENLVDLGFASFKNPNNYFGSQTESAVEDFQKYYGLKVNGVANKATLDKMEEILSSPYQRGNSDPLFIEVKEKLTSLGYASFVNPNDFFGSGTEKALRSFQKAYGLPVSGILDDKTLAKLNKAYEEAKEQISYTKYDISLSSAMAKQMKLNPKPQTDKYRNDPAYVSAKYVKVYDGGKITGSSVNLRSSAKLGSNTNVKATVKRGTTFIILNDNVKGDEFSGSTRWYKIEYDGEVLYVHSALADKTGTRIGKVTGNVNVRASKSGSSHQYGLAKKGSLLTIVDEGKNWHQVSYGAWRNAKESDLKYYMDPRNFANDKVQRFQFLDLSYNDNHADLSAINKLLSGKGVLDGKGEVFIEAGKVHGVNPLYLVSHALLETGNGTSELATGIKYNGKTVYNMYGIGAVDSCPEVCGAREAAERGWTTINKAIIGGASFIGNGYIQAGQNTLYKMRWDPDQMVVGTPNHQYASDVAWASKQITNIYNLYQQLDSYKLILDIPVYK